MQSLQRYRDLLERNGAAGLELLNARVPHRFTGVYALEDGQLLNRYLFDKLGEATPDHLAVVPFADSFCQFVIRDGAFATEDSALDGRLDGHKYQGVMISYHGVPILNNRAQLYGTLCHFDTISHNLPQEEFDFLHKAARELPRFLK